MCSQKANLLALVIVEQPIIQTAVSSVETFDGTKSKFQSLNESVENTAQKSKQDILWITSSKKIGPPLTSAYRLKDCLPYVMWQDIKSELLRQCSKIPFDSHATQAFCQCPTLQMCLHCVSELLSKIHHTTDMAQICAEV